MKPAILVLMAVLGLPGAAVAQSVVFNPTAILFDSPDHATAVSYRVSFYQEKGLIEPVAVSTVPASLVALNPFAPPQYQVQLVDLTPIPSLPVGTTYLVKLIVINAEGKESAPSGASNTFRYSACARPSGTGVEPMTMQVTWPASWTLNQSSAILITVTGPAPVHNVVIDLIGDGQPAWYFVPFDARAATSYTVGPMKRRGRFEITVAISDEYGCSVTLPTRTWVTIS